MTRSILTLTTDFGVGSLYVAAMKGVILSINPEANIVDISHAIPPQDVRQGAIALERACRWFPTGSIHVAVVDPGVGSQRRIVLVQAGGQAFIGPDNGLFSRLARSWQNPTIIHLNRREIWLPEVSTTFHGRDIMAPAAARLSLGMPAEQMGEPLQTLTPLNWAEASVSASSIDGIVESIDSFGNLITNISAAALDKTPRGPDDVRIVCDEHETCGIFSKYADQPEMTLIALVGSDGKLELAIVGDSAAVMLGVRVGAPVRVSW